MRNGSPSVGLRIGALGTYLVRSTVFITLLLAVGIAGLRLAAVTGI